MFLMVKSEYSLVIGPMMCYIYYYEAHVGALHNMHFFPQSIQYHLILIISYICNHLDIFRNNDFINTELIKGHINGCCVMVQSQDCDMDLVAVYLGRFPI